jgi:hypothetical protein
MRSVAIIVKAGILVLGLALLAPASGWAQSSEEQQSLGDVARQEKAKKAKKVVTDEDLPQGTSTSGSEPSQATEGKKEEKAEGAEATQAGETAEAGGEEAAQTKEQEAEKAQSKLEALKADQESTDKMIKHLEDMLANETIDSRRESYASALKHAQEHQAELEKERPEAEKAAAEKEAAAKEGQQSQQPEQPPQ